MVDASSFQYLKNSAPLIWFRSSVVLEMVPAFHVLLSARFTPATHCVNIAIRVFSIMPSSGDFIASFGVMGTL